MHRLIVFWLTSLAMVAAATLAIAQTGSIEPRMFSGSDVGFRLEGFDPTGRPTGRLMVRLNGEWVEAAVTIRPSMGVRPAK